MATSTIKATASKERNTASSSSTWANYSHDSDCNAFDGGYTTRAGGISSSANWNAWYQFPTGSNFLDPAKYTISSATLRIYQPYWGSGVSSAGTTKGTLRMRCGTLTASGTNSISNVKDTQTKTTIATDGTWYEFSCTNTAKALQGGTANGVLFDISDKSSKLWYSRLTYHGGSSYYPRINVTYSNRSYTLAVPSVTGATVSGAGSKTWGSSVTVTCTPATGYRFVRWTLSGGSTATSTSSSYTFTMPTANTTATATVEKIPYTLTVSKPSTGVNSVSGGGTKYYNDSCSVSCTPATGYSFSKWTLSGGSTATSTSNPYKFNMPNANTTATPTVILNKYTIGLGINGDLGSGSVSGDGTYNHGSTVKVTCTPASGYKFVKWTNASGTTVSTNNPYSFSASSSLTLYAVLEKIYSVSVYSSEGIENVTVSNNYPTYGTIVKFEATPKIGYEFLEWQSIDDGSTFVSKQNPLSLNIKEDISLTAYATPVKMKIVLNSEVQNNEVIGNYTSSLTLDFRPKRTGYKIAGWSYIADDDIARYNVDELYNFSDFYPFVEEVDSNGYHVVNLYAVWVKDLSGNIVRVSNGQKWGSYYTYVSVNGEWVKSLIFVSNNGEWKSIE